MAKKKAELEEDSRHYYRLISELQIAHKNCQYDQAIAHAVAAWEYVDGMMQFERRFENQADRWSLDCVEYALRYAPLLFHNETLVALSMLLRSQKRIDKYTTENLSTRLAQAFSLMFESHRLWDHLERTPDAHQDKFRTILGGDQDRWRWIVEQWASMGLVGRIPFQGSYKVSLTTRLETEVRAKCSACGVVAKAAKGRFWEPIKCPKCASIGYFVILVPEET